MSGRIDASIWEERQGWVRRQQESGLSAARFCRENGLNVGNFHAWRQKLAKDSPAQSSLETSRVIGHQPSMRAFVQVPLASTAGAKGSSWIEISLADGMVVRVPASNLAALELVLSALNPLKEERQYA